MHSDCFEAEALVKAYQGIRNSRLSTGFDRISRSTFEKRHKEILMRVSARLLSEQYRPIPYKEILLLKKRDSFPRVLSIPSIQDKVILSIVKQILNEHFETILPEKKVAEFVSSISKTIRSKEFDAYIKIDIKSYYDSIPHEILTSQIRGLVNDEFLINLITKYLENLTLEDGASREGRKCKNSRGVPQGISISNVLGNIYLSEFDKALCSDKNIKYFRYVDDIIIFCDSRFLEKYKTKIVEDLNGLYALEVNQKKCESGKLCPFDFLGYHFTEKGQIEIAQKNIKRLEQSLEKIFSEYISSHDKRIKGNIDLLKWKIDFKIAGCFKGGRRYGWVIFFCQNENEVIFHKLDWLVIHLCKRFGLEKKLIINGCYTGKKFVKTFKEFTSKQDNTDYIPNLDSYSDFQKRDILKRICLRKVGWVDSLNDFMLNREFDQFVFHSIKQIERDLYQIYT